MYGGDVGDGGRGIPGRGKCPEAGASEEQYPWRGRVRVAQGRIQDAQKSVVTLFASTGETGVFLPHCFLD